MVGTREEKLRGWSSARASSKKLGAAACSVPIRGHPVAAKKVLLRMGRLVKPGQKAAG